MDSFAHSEAAAGFESLGTCVAGWGLLGRVSSARGVHLLATHGLPNGRAVNELSAACAMLGYSVSMPPDAGIAKLGAFKNVGPLNYYSPGVSIRLRSSSPVTMAFCAFNPEFVRRLSELEKELQITDLGMLADIKSERLAHLSQLIFREVIEPGSASALFAEAAGLEVAVEISRYDRGRHAADAARRGGLAPWQLNRLNAYVLENLSMDLTLDDLAGLLNMSVRHLSRAVKQEKGVSVHRWIADCRIAEARRLLTETSLTINEIARLSSFHSPAAFSTAFRTATGFAPGEFRRLTLQ